MNTYSTFTFVMCNLGSLQRTKKKPFKVTLQQHRFFFFFLKQKIIAFIDIKIIILWMRLFLKWPKKWKFPPASKKMEALGSFYSDVFPLTDLKSWSLTLGKSLMSIPMLTVVRVLFGREFLTIIWCCCWVTIGTAKKSEESLYFCQQYELAEYWKKANLETVWK